MKKSMLIVAMAAIMAVTPVKQVCAQEVEVAEATASESTELREESSSSINEENEVPEESETSAEAEETETCSSDEMTCPHEAEAPTEEEMASPATPAEDGSESEPIMEDPPERECPSVVEIGEVDYDTDKDEVVNVSASPSEQVTEPASKIKREKKTIESTVKDEIVLDTKDETIMPRVLQARRPTGTKRLGYDRPLTRSVQTGDKENAAMMVIIIGVLVFSMIFFNALNYYLSTAKEYFVGAIVRSNGKVNRYGFRLAYSFSGHDVDSAVQEFRIRNSGQRLAYCRV